MRIEREYSIRQDAPGDPVRADHTIECVETRYCEDAACEARHDDPTAKWDLRTTYLVATATNLERGMRVLMALRAAEPAPKPCPVCEEIGAGHTCCPPEAAFVSMRCQTTEIHQKTRAGRRCTKTAHHEGEHVFGNWSLTIKAAPVPENER